MNGFIGLSPDRRRLLCEQAQTKVGLPPASVEKDFWVCWTLRELFALPGWGENITFKGGTSLSKGWGLIERLSEDIDIVIDREFLGFTGETDPENAPSKKQRRKRLDALKTECQRRIHEELHPALERRLAALLPPEDKWRIVAAPPTDDPDNQTLLFFFPETLMKTAPYLRNDVKIEMGARSDNEPAEEVTIRPYLVEAFPDTLGASDFSTRVLSPERTFWEKAMLLHEETYRPADKKKRKARMARHYYDLWCLITKGIGEKAGTRQDIFDRVVEHRQVYFNWSWMDYSTLRRGSLRLLPPEDQESAWRLDYETTIENMFFGPVPAFDEVLRVAGEFERQFNGTW